MVPFLHFGILGSIVQLNQRLPLLYYGSWVTKVWDLDFTLDVDKANGQASNHAAADNSGEYQNQGRFTLGFPKIGWVAL